MVTRSTTPQRDWKVKSGLGRKEQYGRPAVSAEERAKCSPLIAAPILQRRKRRPKGRADKEHSQKKS